MSILAELIAWRPHQLTHWGRATHICVGKLAIIGSDNGLSPDRRQAIIWTNAGLLLIGPLRRNFSEILIKILTFSFKKMRSKVSSAKLRPFCLGLNVIIEAMVNNHQRRCVAFTWAKFHRKCSKYLSLISIHLPGWHANAYAWHLIPKRMQSREHQQSHGTYLFNHLMLN